MSTSTSSAGTSASVGSVPAGVTTAVGRWSVVLTDHAVPTGRSAAAATRATVTGSVVTCTSVTCASSGVVTAPVLPVLDAPPAPAPVPALTPAPPVPDAAPPVRDAGHGAVAGQDRPYGPGAPQPVHASVNSWSGVRRGSTATGSTRRARAPAAWRT
ncbi:hypothetical protein [Corynebacterium bovis]|uniref:hypothetical protein n=1 Tax=Corynebacterium bovis TaxID=36808 RepID=UPI00313A3C1E